MPRTAQTAHTSAPTSAPNRRRQPGGPAPVAFKQKKKKLLPPALYSERVQPDIVRRMRMRVMGDTAARLATPALRACALRDAEDNLARWTAYAPLAEGNRDDEQTAGLPTLHVFRNDSLDTAKMMTRVYGKTFAVLNMANAHHPGGGYRSGSAAQEENLFRRTDLHFRFRPNEVVDPTPDVRNSTNVRYAPWMSDLINGINGLVYVSTDEAGERLEKRVCIRDSERFEDRDLGYAQLDNDEVFSFYELRSAALDVSSTRWREAPADKVVEDTARRIRAQLDTLKKWGIRHVVLSAFGCGAFGHDPRIVAGVYGQLLEHEAEHFDVVAFGIHYAGRGKGNYEAFRTMLPLCGKLQPTEYETIHELQASLELDSDDDPDDEPDDVPHDEPDDATGEPNDAANDD